jgi:hypothetical protein
MPNANPIDQTRYTLAVLTACLVKALANGTDGLQERFEANLVKAYDEIREQELSHIGVMETLTWTREILRQL